MQCNKPDTHEITSTRTSKSLKNHEHWPQRRRMIPQYVSLVFDLGNFLLNIQQYQRWIYFITRLEKLLAVNVLILAMIVFRLFEVFHPTRDFFTHLETSQLPMKGCKFWPMLGTYDHRAVRILSVLRWHGASVYNGHLQGPVTPT